MNSLRHAVWSWARERVFPGRRSRQEADAACGVPAAQMSLESSFREFVRAEAGGIRRKTWIPSRDAWDNVAEEGLARRCAAQILNGPPKRMGFDGSRGCGDHPNCDPLVVEAVSEP
jgi:hypothetical protein